MGKKKTEEAPPPVPAPTNKPDEQEEDTPVVKALKELDDKFCIIETELEKQIETLRKKYNEKQAPILAERSSKLSSAAGVSEEDAKEGTPACKGFWLQAMQNTALKQVIEDWDEPVLAYLIDITRSKLDEQNPQKGLKLDFSFKENPYFTNSSLSLEVHTDYNAEGYKPWKEPECVELKGTEIDWKPGKNVTVEVTQKKPKGGGAKKQKQKGKSKEEPRDSFFRHIFRSLKVGDDAPPELAAMMMGDMEDDDDMDDEDLVSEALENGYDMANVFAQELIPYAVRFYTGEAAEEDSDDDEDSESEDEDDDDDDDEDESEDEPAPAKGKKKPQGKKGGGKGYPGGEKQEECKQQ